MIRLRSGEHLLVHQTGRAKHATGRPNELPLAGSSGERRCDIADGPTYREFGAQAWFPAQFGEPVDRIMVTRDVAYPSPFPVAINYFCIRCDKVTNAFGDKSHRHAG